MHLCVDVTFNLCFIISQYEGLLFTGSQDCSVRLWEILTGRCMRTVKFKFPVKDVAWNPNSSYSTVAAAVYVFCDLLVLSII